jgi:hypothetical protein
MRMRRDIRDELLRALAEPRIWLERMESRNGSILSYWRITGRNVRGVPRLGIRPTGRALDIEAVTVDSVVDGVSQSRTLIDLSLLVAQIGDAADRSATA